MAGIDFNIRRLRLDAGMSQDQLGERLGKTRSAISQYESGKIVPRMGVIEDMASIFNVPKAEIIGDTPVASGGFMSVPLHGRVAAGVPIEMLPVDDMKEAPSRYVDDDPNAFLVRVIGDSMNRCIHSGNYALVSPKYVEPNDRDMFLVTVNGYDATIKRVHKLANGVELIPDSYDPTYRSQVYDFNEVDTPTVKIIGKVVWWCREF